MPTRAFGWTAVSLSLVYKFPQIFKIGTTGNIAGISVLSQIVQASAYCFYIIHGSVIGDPPIILLGFASLAQSIILILQYFYFSYHPNNVAEGIAAQSVKIDSQEEDTFVDIELDNIASNKGLVKNI